MTKNEMDAVMTVLEQVAVAAYEEGYEDGIARRGKAQAKRFLVGRGTRMLLEREINRRSTGAQKRK